LGVLGLLAYIFWFALVVGADFKLNTKTVFLCFIAFPALSFAVPFCLTRAVAWVVEGFGKQDS